MRKILKLLIAALATIALQSGHRVWAHFPATDGNITAIMHIEPGDDATAGQPSRIDFIFEDTTNRFKLSNCTCVLSVSQQGQELFYAPLTATQFDEPTVYGGGAAYTFPSSGSYHISLAGRPVAKGAFQPFNLTWGVSVAPQPTDQDSSSIKTFLIYFAAIIGVLLLIGIIFFLVG